MLCPTCKRDEVAEGKIRDAQVKRLPAHVSLFREHPEEARNVLRGYDIDPDSLDENLQLKKAPASSSAAPQPKATHRFNPDTGKIEALP